MWTHAGPNRTDPIAQDDGQTIFTMIAKVEDHGSDLTLTCDGPARQLARLGIDFLIAA